MELRAGFRFMPSDEDLVTFLTEKVNGRGEARSTDRVVLGECDMYGEKEPWNIWNDHGGLKLNVNAGEDLYFFTKLKKVSVNGSRNHKRRVGSGTWSGAYGVDVAGGFAKKKHFSYENKGCSEHHLAWIMHEYSLVDGSADYVLCRLRRKIKKTQSKLMSTSQTRNLPHVNDQEIMIKKQRLGVKSHQDPITIQNVEDQQHINFCSKTNNIENIIHYQPLSDNDDVINYMQDDMQVDDVFESNTAATISTPSFNDVCDFSELFGSDSVQEAKEIRQLDDEFGSIVGAKPDDEELKEISFQEFNLSVVKSSTSGLESFAEELQSLLEIDDDDHGNNVAKLSSSTDDEELKEISFQEFNLSVVKSSSTSGLESFAEELQSFWEIDDDDHGNNVAKLSSSTGGPGDQISISENDHALKSLFESHEELEELEKILDVNYSQPTAGAHLSHQRDDHQVEEQNNNNVVADHLSQVDYYGVVQEQNEVEAEDEEYLSGKKSFAEQLKDVPLYYEAHDHEDVSMDTLRVLDL